MENDEIRVLLIDDDEMIRDCVTAYLEDEGFTVLCAESGEAGLASIVRFDPAVCISDLRLCGMNGEEFIVRAAALCPGTRFLMHTGTLYTLSDELCAIGMTPEDILLKPIHELSTLVDKIRRLWAAGK